ncbi:hypothetical protein ACT91Q_07275 [Brevibacillus thermoruber]|jgi:hypothetical protein|uniref:hypothetical protein n=1 Tax=Brevibacillus thermoruber TaxID=33942 RepID=UPI004041DD1F
MRKIILFFNCIILLVPIGFFFSVLVFGLILISSLFVSIFGFQSEQSAKALAYLNSLFAVTLFAYYGDLIIDFVVKGRKFKNHASTREASIILQKWSVRTRQISYLLLTSLTIMTTFVSYLNNDPRFILFTDSYPRFKVFLSSVTELSFPVLVSFIAVDRYIEKFVPQIINRLKDKEEEIKSRLSSKEKAV